MRTWCLKDSESQPIVVSYMLFAKIELINSSLFSRMKFFKSQITKLKSQINHKSQNSNPKQISEYIMDQINSTWLRHELYSASLRHELRSKAKTCLDHWSLEFGYCLLFVIWCLEFFIFKDSTIFRYYVRLF